MRTLHPRRISRSAAAPHLGQTPVDLVSVHLTAPATGTQVLAALFNTNVHLSEVMAAAPVQVNYSIDKSGTNYTTTGPANAPFTIDVPYPSGQPSSDAQVHPVYTGGSGSGGGGTEYSGTVDLSELGGPPITGEFRLGYQGRPRLLADARQLRTRPNRNSDIPCPR